MNKDVLYIDVEDDITAISGKIKASKEKVVALVPPKRIGVLQSAVNLRILQRTAKLADKHIAIISSDASLLPVAAAAGIPVAKNLHSKPEIPVISQKSVEDESDIIDGSALPVGEHAATTTKPSLKQRARDAAASTAAAASFTQLPKSGDVPAKSRGSQKVPNFSSFRKKLFIGVLLLIGLIAFLVWAIFFAPRATVAIQAKTSDQAISTSVTVSPSVTTDAAKNTLKTRREQEKQDIAVDFTATGKKDVGTKATGSMTIKRTSVSSDTIQIPVGTAFSSGNYTFTSTQAASLQGTKIGSGGLIQDSTTISVQATQNGQDYNLAPTTYRSTIDGFSATGSQMNGGTSKTVAIVTQSDVQAAAEQLATQNSDAVKARLQQKLQGAKVVEGSFAANRADATPNPAVGQEAPDGKAKLTSVVTYSLDGIASNDLDSFLKQALDMKLSKDNSQRVFDAGTSTAKLANFAAAEGDQGTAKLTATGKIGPHITDNDVKKRVKGKRFGDIQGDLKTIEGVQDVQVRFWPFWVNTVPQDDSKISVEFNVQNAK
jgi:hypothetical protein